VRRLVTQGALVEKVTDEAEAEDCRSEGVACCLAVSAEDAGEELGAVFCGDVRDRLVMGSVNECEPLRATMLEKTCQQQNSKSILQLWEPTSRKSG
jgi:hypothetical protein